jgi:thiamine-phosphate pyrophosphorylase
MMTQALSSPVGVWPPGPAHEALAARAAALAGQFRAIAGEAPATPAATPRWRLCMAPPPAFTPADILVGPCPDGAGARALDAGGYVLDADGDVVTLRRGQARWTLKGSRADDWLAAFAAFLALSGDPYDAHDALVLALAWRPASARWPDNPATFPAAIDLDAPAHAFPACPARLGLYPVLPSADWIERVLACGVRTVQLRAKGLAAPALREEIARAVAAARACDAALFINDHWREAIDAGAYGVHLGQEDLRVADLDAIGRAGLRLGLSTHGYYELLLAMRMRPSYVAMGAVFPTTTKDMPTAPQGLDKLARYAALARAHGVPSVAIGGIDLQRMPAVLATGVGSAAVVRAVTEAGDLRAAIATLQSRFCAAI